MQRIVTVVPGRRVVSQFMGKNAMRKDAKETDDSGNLLRRMSDGNDNVVEKVIPFLNDDVPNYIQNLARFEEMSRSRMDSIIIR